MKNIRQNLCRDRIPFCCDTDYCNIENVVETEEELRKKRPLSRQGNVCHDTERRSFCHDKVIYVATLKEEETLVMTDKQSCDI